MESGLGDWREPTVQPLGPKLRLQVVITLARVKCVFTSALL